MVEKCKYCGAKKQAADEGSVYFECETAYRIKLDYWDKSAECVGATIAGYRRLFPVLPRDESPITPEVCKTLGLVYEPQWDLWRLEFDGKLLLSTQRGNVMFGDAMLGDPVFNNVVFSNVTAGQLSLLVAFVRSRESQHEKGKTPE